MDVSRIEAISPKQIDWRKLTAKEIIKYDNQGVEVPPEYLQWAKDFRADLTANDKDETAVIEKKSNNDMYNSGHYRGVSFYKNANRFTARRR